MTRIIDTNLAFPKGATVRRKHTALAIRDDFKFFFENAGYIVGERAKGALDLARAERYAFDSGFRFEWTDDEDPDRSWEEDAGYKGPGEYLCCRLIRVCPHCNVESTAASLCGIVDPDDNYRRIIEAELAAEVKAETEDRS